MVEFVKVDEPVYVKTNLDCRLIIFNFIHVD